MYSTTARVGASQTGPDGLAKLAAALDIIQDCSLFWLDSEPALRDYFLENGLALILSSRQVEVLRLPAYGEEVKATTSISGCKSYYGYRDTVLYGQDGAPCILTASVGVFVNVAGGRMAKLPQEVLDTLTYDPVVEMADLGRRIPTPQTGGTPLPPLPVRRWDIDVNHHVNNARYLEAALEMLPHSFAPRLMRLEYKLAAKHGDVFHPVLYEEEDSTVLALQNAEGKPFTMMAFMEA